MADFWNEANNSHQFLQIDSCAICLEYYEHAEKVKRSTKCLHVFHETCIIDWLGHSNECPCCRGSYMDVELGMTTSLPAHFTRATSLPLILERDSLEYANLDNSADPSISLPSSYIFPSFLLPHQRREYVTSLLDVGVSLIAAAYMKYTHCSLL